MQSWSLHWDLIFISMIFLHPIVYEQYDNMIVEFEEKRKLFIFKTSAKLQAILENLWIYNLISSLSVTFMCYFPY